MLQTHRNLIWSPAPAGTMREAARLRRLDVLAAMVGREPLDAAWQAWADDVPMSWLPIDHYGPAARSRRDGYDDAARRAGPGVL